MSRAYFTAQRLAELDQRLSDRERSVLDSLRRLRLASGDQLDRLHFTDTDSRQRRRVLAGLVERSLLARLPRAIGGVRAGSAGYIYALGRAGQRLTDGTGPAGGRIERPWTPGLPFLAHSLAVSEVYVRLIEASRRRYLDVLTYVTEPRTWRRFIGAGGGRSVLKPDAYLLSASGDFEDRWFIEVDRATESPATLDAKLRTYRQYWRSGLEQPRHRGVFPKVLYLVPNDARLAVVKAAIGRQPAETEALFAACRFDQAVERIAQGAAS